MIAQRDTMALDRIRFLSSLGDHSQDLLFELKMVA